MPMPVTLLARAQYEAEIDLLTLRVEQLEDEIGDEMQASTTTTTTAQHNNNNNSATQQRNNNSAATAARQQQARIDLEKDEALNAEALHGAREEIEALRTRAARREQIQPAGLQAPTTTTTTTTQQQQQQQSQQPPGCRRRPPVVNHPLRHVSTHALAHARTRSLMHSLHAVHSRT